MVVTSCSNYENVQPINFHYLMPPDSRRRGKLKQTSVTEALQLAEEAGPLWPLRLLFGRRSAAACAARLAAASNAQLPDVSCQFLRIIALATALFLQLGKFGIAWWQMSVANACTRQQVQCSAASHCLRRFPLNDHASTRCHCGM